MPDDERDDDATQALPSADEPTRAMPVPEEDDATRRIGSPPPTEATPTQALQHDTVVSPAPPMARAGTYATERIVLPPRMSLAPWLMALIIIVALAGGATLGYTQTRPSDKNVVARALVSPNGGVMRFEEAGRLSVPKGALSSPTAITIRRSTLDHPVRLGAEDDPRSITYQPGELVVYSFEPSDLRFQQPVTIELPRRGDGTAVFVDVRGSPHVVAGQANGKAVTIQTMSFSFTKEQEPVP